MGKRSRLDDTDVVSTEMSNIDVSDHYLQRFADVYENLINDAGGDSEVPELERHLLRMAAWQVMLFEMRIEEARQELLLHGTVPKRLGEEINALHGSYRASVSKIGTGRRAKDVTSEVDNLADLVDLDD